MQADAVKLVLSGFWGAGWPAIRPPQNPLPFRGGNEGVKRGNRGEFGRTGPEAPSWQGICLLGDGEIVEGDVLVLENLRFGFGFLGRGAG